MKIYRAKENRIYLWDLTQWILKFPDLYKNRIGISWKVGKRRKLRSYHISWNTWECECCGRITSITLQKGGKEYRMDNHFGPSHMDMTYL